MSMINLYDETITAIKNSGHELNDIVAIFDSNYDYEINAFFASAKEYNYNDGFGGEEVPPSLVITFYDKSWLRRRTYDGSEWWEFQKYPVVGYIREYIKKADFKILWMKI